MLLTFLSCVISCLISCHTRSVKTGAERFLSWRIAKEDTKGRLSLIDSNTAIPMPRWRKIKIKGKTSNGNKNLAGKFLFPWINVFFSYFSFSSRFFFFSHSNTFFLFQHIPFKLTIPLTLLSSLFCLKRLPISPISTRTNLCPVPPLGSIPNLGTWLDSGGTLTMAPILILFFKGRASCFFSAVSVEDETNADGRRNLARKKAR